MSLADPIPTPALRVQDRNSNVLIQPVILTPGIEAKDSPNGLGLVNAPLPDYGPEVFGPNDYFGYSRSPSLLGFRRTVRLDIECVWDSARSNFGARLLLDLYNRAWVDNTFAQLQACWFYPNANSAWIGIYPTTGWKLVPITGKLTPGTSYLFTLEAYAQGLGVPQIPDWSNGFW